MSYMDIPYRLDESAEPPACRFRSVWKVQANDAYQVAQSNGFAALGLFVTYEGQGSLTVDRTVDSGRFELQAGTFVFVQAEVPCSYRCRDGDWKFYFFEFDGLERVRHWGLPIGRVATTARMPEAVRKCEQLIDGMIVQPIGYRDSAHNLLNELLLLFAREPSIGRAKRHPELDAVLYRMHKNIGTPFRVDEAVRDSGLSRTAFFSRFRETTGTSPAEYMLGLKLASAKASLEATNLSVKEIAAALHFYDEFHFSKTFKRRYGVSPRDYRRGGRDPR
ncbi:AraC family transcriptional regulator [Cohnella nanjingensis]|uniref:AraC family transcriptional regulator n=1 Tax=Cohnella nanjingensis TaxID=1387779 RepID=A0A7X0VGM1_9BACL|nr:AraC family transcriptional regulator [Cohnella nanjingensis]MBB6672503.1 AraC family transcriptional regulator [Cohnella nanjingensis]